MLCDVMFCIVDSYVDTICMPHIAFNIKKKTHIGHFSKIDKIKI